MLSITISVLADRTGINILLKSFFKVWCIRFSVGDPSLDLKYKAVHGMLLSVIQLYITNLEIYTSILSLIVCTLSYQ